MNRAALKAKAKKSINDKIFILLAIYIIVAALTAVLTFITFGIGGILISGGVMLSMAFIYLGVVGKNRTPQINDIAFGFSSKTYLNGLVGYLRYTIFTALWSMLFVIPGVIKGISYSMMFYIMAENPTMDPGKAQKKSMAMTDGYKGDLFVLYLSFIPWFLLIGVTFGLASVYVVPYLQATLALYYEALKKKQEK